MKIFKKIGAWLSKNDTNLAEHYKQQYDDMKFNYERACSQNDALRYSLSEALKTNSELQDEINIQKAKAAKYLSYYLQEMEKHAPND